MGFRAFAATLLLLAPCLAGALPDPGEAPPAHAPFQLPFETTDAVFDAARGMLYASSKASRRVYFVDLASGLVTRQFSFEWQPESLALTPDGSRLFVGLLTRAHSPYWWDEDGHEGYVASFDLNLQVKDRQFRIAEDPYDLLAKSNGQLVVSSGSGQWTYMRVFDGATGAQLGAVSGVRQGTRLALYPNQSIVYAADNGISPSDIERYDVDAAGRITARWDSIYHGDHRMSGNVWASPRGDVLITRGGDVFSAAGTSSSTDMIYLRGLTPDSIEALAFDASRGVVLAARARRVSYFNLESLEWIADATTSNDVHFIGVDELDVYTLSTRSTGSTLERSGHLVPNGSTNTRPVAAFDVSPTPPHTTLTDLTLDASASSDAESALLYRWDLEDDGEWDTEFSPDPTLAQRFETAGTKLVRLQVKDAVGAVASALRSLDVAFEADPGSPPETHPSFELPFAITHAVFDPVRPYLYVSSKARRAVYFVDLETGFIVKTFAFSWQPENLAITPDGSRLYVALLTREHSPYWWDEDGHEGYIASFDLNLQVKDRQFRIPEDPFGLVAKDNGQIVVSSGSGQWTDARVFNGVTGAQLGAISGVREGTRLALHPNQSIVYGADTDISPSDIERYDVDAAGRITMRWDSIYHGDHPMGGNLWLSPLGNLLVTRGGGAYSVPGATREADMQFLRTLTPAPFEGLAYDATRRVIFTGRDGEIAWHNLHSLENIGASSVAGDVSYVGVRGLDLYAVQVEAAASRILRLAHPLPNGDTETPPRADVVVTPAAGWTTRSDVRLDASGSSDLEGALLYRWDLDGNGVWDTAFSPSPVLVHRFQTAGTKFLRVQVKDAAGWVSEKSFQLDVAFEPDPGSPGAPHPGFAFEFPITDIVFDPLRPYAYLSSKQRRQVHFVNLATGFIEKTFDFPWMPESLALTPDGNRLFVSLLTQEHSYYWFGAREGYIASFDLNLQLKDRQFRIPEDPFDLLATSNGRLVVSGGSGQSSSVRVFDGATGAQLGITEYAIYQGTRLSMHPSESIVYGADNGLSPSDIERYDIDAAGRITYRWDSPYHGDHRMSGNVWVSPLGDAMVTRGGDVFSSAGTLDDDMVYLRSLTPDRIEDLAYDAVRNVIFTGGDTSVGFYNLRSYEAIGSSPVPGEVRAVGVRALHVYALVTQGSGARLVELAHPLPHGDTDALPVAHLALSPTANYDTQTDIRFDASGSTDAEGPIVYRWDLDDDGVWDTGFGSDPVHVHRYSLAGSKVVRLQVKDTAGNVDEVDVPLDVAFAPDPGVPGEQHPRFQLLFEAADIVFDPLRPYAYVTSLEKRSLYFVNLDSGFIERAFSFAEMPERMTISPDGSRLFVALLTQPHSSYWWDDEQRGFVARFDLDLQVKDRQFSVSLDPFDLAATPDGGLVITSGSGQWTRIVVYDGDSGLPRGEARYTIRERSALELHPSGGMVYTAGGSSYPQDVHRWTLQPGAGIEYAWDSIYHGHHQVGDDLWISPQGDVIVTTGGDVYSANGSSRTTDILYQRSLGDGSNWLRDLVWSPRQNEFASIEDGRVRVFDMQSYAQRGSFTLRGSGRFLGRRGALLYAVQIDQGESLIEVLVHDNHPPVARATAALQLECEGSHGASVRFDGTASSDADSDENGFADIVAYRWLQQQPGSDAWTPLGEGASLDVTLPPGRHKVRLEVTDRAGAASSAEVEVSVVDTRAPELTVTAKPSYLSPPNRRLMDVALEVTAHDVCGGVDVVLGEIGSNAPPHPWQGIPWLAWLIPPDIQGASPGTDDRSVRLRAEQNWDGSRRVYRLRYAAVDAAGNRSEADVTVPVLEADLWTQLKRLLIRLARFFA